MNNPAEFNPLLGKVKLPGRVFQLPSKGLFYPPGVLADHVKDGEIQVKPMSALAEIKIRSADLLFSGKIIRELCQECVPEILRPEQLITKDVDALFTFMRVATYGTLINVVTSHDCQQARPHDLEINLEPILGNPRNAILAHKDTLYKVTLSNGQIANIKPPTYEGAMNVAVQRSQIAKLERDGETIDEKLLETIMLDDMCAVIASVETDLPDGQHVVVTKYEHIVGWLRSITKTMMNELLAGVRKADQWGFDFSQEVTCPECGEKYRHTMELDPINFFFG